MDDSLRFEVLPDAQAGFRVVGEQHGNNGEQHGNNCSPLPRAKRRHAQKPILVPTGSVVVRIYPGQVNGYKSHLVYWRDSNGPHRVRRGSLEDAKQLAEDIGIDVLNGQTAMLGFREDDRASYNRALEILGPTRKTLELACSEYAEALNALTLHAPRSTIAEAVKFFLEHRPAGVIPKDIDALVAELLQRKRDQKKGAKWLGALDQQLGRFAGHFKGPLHALRGHDITAWLESLKVGLRTRKNYRGAVLELVRYAQARNYLARTWDEMKHVEDLEVDDTEIRILTPDQLIKLLAVAPASLVPFIALAAFAGVRHEEMINPNHGPELDWSDINWDDQVIEVPKDVGKTGDRNTPIQANLLAWLKKYRRPDGPICSLANGSNALYRAKLKAGIPSGKNETRNTLRKSFISYRLALVKHIGQVAEEAGTSPQKIKTNYKKAARLVPAKRWFDIWPTCAEILQLPLALK